MVRDTCLICGEALHSSLVAQGAETHANCEPTNLEQSMREEAEKELERALNLATEDRPKSICALCGKPMDPRAVFFGAQTHNNCDVAA